MGKLYLIDEKTWDGVYMAKEIDEDLIDNLREEISELKEKIKELEAEIERLGG